MKYSVACLLATTNALTIRNKAAPAAPTCSSNYDRLQEQKAYTIDSDFVTSNLVGGKFVDPSFGSDDSVLYNELQTTDSQFAGQVTAYKNTQKSPGVEWKRPSEVQPGATLWGPAGTPDINVKISEQGYDGDCWFLSTASALAAYPKRIMNMFPGQNKIAENGAYQVKLWVRGEPVNVVVDDQFPRYNWSSAQGYTENYPALNDSPSKDGYIWLQVLEKGMAKLFNNYTGINSGQIAEAMRIMTGQPSHAYPSNTMTDDDLWSLVTNGFAKDYSMGAGCQVSHFNMISGHAYGVIGHATLTGGANDGQQLILMRNPWGNNHYDGPWSEKSTLWTADYRKQAGNYGTGDIGEFWIPLESWRDDYTSLSVNYYNEDWKVTSVEGKDFKWDVMWSDQNVWLTIDNPVAQDVAFECTQNDDRLFPNSTCSTKDTPLEYYYMMFDDSMKQIHGDAGSSSAICTGGVLAFHDFPAGKTQIRIAETSKGSLTDKDSLFHLRAFGATSAVAITQATGNTYVYN